MIETIDKVRQKVSKLLIRINNLERELVASRWSKKVFREKIAIQAIERKDELLKDTKANKEHIAFIDELLLSFDVKQISTPLDKLADFTEVVGKVKDASKRDGLVKEVVRLGYFMDDELLRPTNVIVVEN